MRSLLSNILRSAGLRNMKKIILTTELLKTLKLRMCAVNSEKEAAIHNIYHNYLAKELSHEESS